MQCTTEHSYSRLVSNLFSFICGMMTVERMLVVISGMRKDASFIQQVDVSKVPKNSRQTITHNAG